MAQLAEGERMAFRRCESGEHTYDDSQHSSCPFCRKTRLTLPPGGSDIPVDIPPPQSPPPMPGKTTPANGSGGGSSNSDSKKTRIIFDGDDNKTFGDVLPVVGWLVVVNGKGRGRELRIQPGMNNIGREKGEILLNFGDASISREKHARLAYDPDENTFSLVHLEGRNLTKVNGKAVMTTCELTAYDHIRMGETEMIFVPFCGQNFSWKASGG